IRPPGGHLDRCDGRRRRDGRRPRRPRVRREAPERSPRRERRGMSMAIAKHTRAHRSAGARAPGRLGRILRPARTAITAGLLILVCGLLVVAVGVPIATGSNTYSVLTRSMEPGLPPGTLLVVRPAAAGDLHVGDVVTYQLSSGKPDVVTHRIVRVE